MTRSVKKADEIMCNALQMFSDNSGFLFEMAQYYAKRCNYSKAIEYYELSWSAEENKKPRFTDALHGISIIYEILGEYEKAAQTYDRLIVCLKEEWGYHEEDAAIIDAERQKKRIQDKAIQRIS